MVNPILNIKIYVCWNQIYQYIFIIGMSLNYQYFHFGIYRFIYIRNIVIIFLSTIQNNTIHYWKGMNYYSNYSCRIYFGWCCDTMVLLQIHLRTFHLIDGSHNSQYTQQALAGGIATPGAITVPCKFSSFALRLVPWLNWFHFNKISIKY